MLLVHGTKTVSFIHNSGHTTSQIVPQFIGSFWSMVMIWPLYELTRRQTCCHFEENCSIQKLKRGKNWELPDKWTACMKEGEPRGGSKTQPISKNCYKRMECGYQRESFKQPYLQREWQRRSWATRSCLCKVPLHCSADSSYCKELPCIWPNSTLVTQSLPESSWCYHGAVTIRHRVSPLMLVFQWNEPWNLERTSVTNN